MVCNDLAIANSCMKNYQENGSPVLAHVRRGGRLYSARMMSGHLHEGLKALQAIKESLSLSKLVRQCGPKAQNAFGNLCECLVGGNAKQEYEKYVGLIRHKVAFHYDPTMLDKAIEDRAQREESDRSSLTAGPDIHSNRFEFGDDILDSIVCRQLWNIPRTSDLRAEADGIAMWCGQKCLEYLQFGEDFVPRFLRENSVTL